LLSNENRIVQPDTNHLRLITQSDFVRRGGDVNQFEAYAENQSLSLGAGNEAEARIRDTLYLTPGAAINDVQVTKRPIVEEGMRRVPDSVAPLIAEVREKAKDKGKGRAGNAGDLERPFHAQTALIERRDKAKDNRKKAAESYDKLMRARPRTRTHTSTATGETMWDHFFPLTAGHRFNKIPYRDVAEYPSVQYPEDDCVLEAMSAATRQPREILMMLICRVYPRDESRNPANLSLRVMDAVALHYGTHFRVTDDNGLVLFDYGVKRARTYARFLLKDGHLTCLDPMRALVITDPRPKMGSRKEHMALFNTVKAIPIVQFRMWMPSKKRAADYVRALIAGTTGLLGEPINREKLMEWDSSVASFRATARDSRQISVILGDPGCRKSSALQKILRKDEFKKLGNFTVILPTNVLAQDWRDKLDATKEDNRGRAMPGEMVMTFEKALARVCNSSLVVTDEDKFPKGYLDLLAILSPDIHAFIFLGDPWQSTWHEPNADCLLNDPSIIGNAKYLSQYSGMFMLGTWRYGEGIANFFRQPTFVARDSGFRFCDVMPTKYEEIIQHFPHLVPADLLRMWDTRLELYAAHFDTVWAEQLRGSDAVSFAGSQGLTASLVIIEVDERVLRGSDPKLLYTAMTRAPFILFVQKWGQNGRADLHEASHPIFRILRHYRINYHPGKRTIIEPDHTVDIREATNDPFPETMELVLAGPKEKMQNMQFLSRWYDFSSMRVIDPDDTRAGARLDYDDDVYKEAYDFKPHIDKTVEPDVIEPVMAEFGLPAVKLPTALPRADKEVFVEFHNAQRLERYEAEIFLKEYSVQKPDTPQRRGDAVKVMRALVTKAEGKTAVLRRRNVQMMLSQLPETQHPLFYNPDLLNWGLDQRADDKVSFLAAVKQRIRYRSIEQNNAQLKDQRDFGLLCWKRFKRYMNWGAPIPFNDLEYQRAIQAFQIRRGERSEAMKRGSLNRADPDYGIFLTAKTQMKVKERESGTMAKPLQPVVIHADNYLFKFGPAGIYLLEKVLENKPDWWHFHAKCDHRDLQAWIKRWFADDCDFQMNDQKGQDQSVQGWAVVFFSELLTFFGFSDQFVFDFRSDKVSKTIKDKVLAIMTNSGEIWTYLINTMSSAARECAMYDLPPGLPMANGGDDLMRAPYGSLAFDYVNVRDQDPTIDKRYLSDKGDFISFFVRKGVLTKDPIILLKRFLIKISQGKAEDAVLGYFDLWSMNYALGDVLYDVFDEDEMEAHSLLTRIMFNLRKEGLQTRPDWTKVRIDGELHEENAYKWFTELSEVQEQQMFADVLVRQEVKGIVSEFQQAKLDINALFA